MIKRSRSKSKSKNNEESSTWQDWSSDGRLATVAWFFTFVAYSVFRLANVDAPELTNVFVTVTGIWVGNLGISQSKRISNEVEKRYGNIGHEYDNEEHESSTGDKP